VAIKIWLDSKGVERAMLNGTKLAQVEREIMEQKVVEVQAQFLMDFGMGGEFDVVAKLSRPSRKFGTSRTKYRIVANNAKTAAILKRHPGWLAKFIE